MPSDFIAVDSPERRLAKAPDALLRRRIEHLPAAAREAGALEVTLDSSHARQQFFGMVTVELDAEQGRAITVDHRAPLGVEHGMALGVPKDEIVHHFHGGRPVLQDQRGGAEGVEQLIELNGQHCLARRQWHQPDLRIDDEAEGAFGTHQDPRQVNGTVRIHELVEVVAANAAQDLGEPAVDLCRVAPAECRHRSIRAGFNAVAPLRVRQLRGRERPQVDQPTVRQHHPLFADVIDGLAVEHRPRAARVVGHHPANGGAAGRRHIRGEAEVEWPQLRVQLIQHHARLDPGPSLVGVDLENPVQVLRGIEHQAGANRLAGLRRAAAAWRDRDAVAGGHVDGLNDPFGRTGNDHAQRLNLVDAGVGRVEGPRHAVEPHLTVNGRFKFALEGLAHGLLALAARGNWPHAFDAVATQRVEVIVEVHGGIAVRWDEFQSIAHLYVAW